MFLFNAGKYILLKSLLILKSLLFSLFWLSVWICISLSQGLQMLLGLQATKGAVITRWHYYVCLPTPQTCTTVIHHLSYKCHRAPAGCWGCSGDQQCQCPCNPRSYI